MKTCTDKLAILSCLLLAILNSPVTAARTEVVAADWYFRETLVAIRDWETILAEWGKETPPPDHAFTFPVPQNGEMVEWPNPIVNSMLPETDRSKRVKMQFKEGKILVTRSVQGANPSQETIKAGAPLTGYWHPGGGGKDRWYHRYDRAFDAVGVVRPIPAPYAVRVRAPLDWRRGANPFRFELRNITQTPQRVEIRLVLYGVEQKPKLTERAETINGGDAQTFELPVELMNEGGAFLLLHIKVGEITCQIPFLTHVENVRAILRSLEQILADTPDPRASEALVLLRQSVLEWSAKENNAGEVWRALFAKASAWRDRLLLHQIRFDSLLFVKRKPFDSEQPYMDAHHLHNPPGGSLCRLSPVRPDGLVRPVVDSLGPGIYRNLCLHWNARKLLFAFGNGSDLWDGTQSYHVYEVLPDGTGLRQLTFGPKNDCEPFYLPNGQIGFTSDRGEHFVMCGAARHVSNLFTMEADGAGLRQLSYNVFNEFTPALMPDGRILYSRWEYNERSVTSMHNPFTMFPDGSMVATYYGNASIRPNVYMFARPVPGSGKVMALFTAHHGQTHGPIGLINHSVAVDGPQAIELLTPNIPVTGEKAEDSRYGWFSDPMPLSEGTYLCSFTPTVVPWLDHSWAVYIGDRHGNLALVYRDPSISCMEPVPLMERPAPLSLSRVSTTADIAAEEATLMMTDVYNGLPGVSRGEARYLRILEDIPRKSVHEGGVVITSGTGIYTIKRILGVVPIAADGSAHFTVPANRNIYFEALDENQLEIQRMRSVICLKPGECRTCAGCHESRLSAPVNKPVAAGRRPPDQPVRPPWGDAIFSFLRDVQPVLNRHCVKCHTYDRARNIVILTDDLTDRFTVAYEELLPYVKVANAMRWDYPEDVLAQRPYTYGSKVSPLTRLLARGHHGVQLAEEERLRLVNWIDANAVYYDCYDSVYGDSRGIFSGAFGAKIKGVYTRRCAACHSDGDGSMDTWWRTINRHEAALSRALKAPLARQAGGWERCEGAVFANTEDVDYKLLLAAFTSLREQMAQRPREDLRSLRDTAAERQMVTYPEPPPPRVATPPSLPTGHWVYLSDLTWQSAKAGWSINQDGLPRKDQDAENHRLRLANHSYRRGLGTHAPSEITYRLGGAFDRFYCQVGAAETGGTVVFQVYADAKLVFASGVMRGLNGLKTVDVPVDGAQTLRLVVTDAGDGISGDMANWADARLRQVESALR